MPDVIVPPKQCKTMDEVRAGVDALDAGLVRLIAQRFAYMRAAARIKTGREQIRDEPRKAEVVANARMIAEQLGIPSQLVAEIWDRLVEGSIAYEMEEWDKISRE